MELLNYFSLDGYYSVILLINLAVALILLIGIKFTAALISNVNATHELAEKDNPAFGISLAGVILGVTIMMTGIIAGEASTNYLIEFALVTGYGILGILLMSFTRLIFDKISMPDFSIGKAISQGNIAAGVLDAGNVIATAIIIRAILIWVDNDSLFGFTIVIIGYALSQIILSIASFYRLMLFNRHHQASMQQSLEQGNLAIAWRFTGFRIGIALAITAASGLIPFYNHNLAVVALVWVCTALIMMFVVALLAELVDLVLLAGIHVREEVDQQNNIAVGVIQCVVTIAIGIVIASLAN